MVAADAGPWVKATIAWPDVRGADVVRKVAQDVSRARSVGSGLHLDFSSMQGDSAERASLRWVAALGNLILTGLEDLPLRVGLPAGDPARLLIYRSGLMYGVARRQRAGGKVVIDGLQSRRPVEQWLRLWSEPWRPGGPGMDGKLLDDEPRPVDTDSAVREIGALINRSNAKNAIRVIIDPHRREKATIRQSAALGLARGWIGSVLPGSRDDDLLQRRRLWKDVVTQRILTEALDNIVDHAFARPAAVAPLAEREAASFVALARTDGGGDKSAPRLQLVVADNGYGVPATIRAKLAAGPTADGVPAEGTGPVLAAHAFRQKARTATDPGLLWARTGFATALSEAPVDDEAELAMLTSDDATGTLVLVTIDRHDEMHAEAFADVPFQGTTILATLPMPHRPVAGPEAHGETAPEARTDRVDASAR